MQTSLNEKGNFLAQKLLDQKVSWLQEILVPKVQRVLGLCLTSTQTLEMW